MSRFLIPEGLGGGQLAPGDIPATTPTIRVVPVSATETFLIAPHATLGAIALHLLKGNGADLSTPGDSVGAPFGDWRIRGFRVLPSVASDPVTQATEIVSDGIGAQQIAIRRTTGGGWAGQYHGFGAGSAYGQTGSNLSAPAELTSVEITSTGRAVWSDGGFYDFSDVVELTGTGMIRTVTTVSMPFDPNIAYLDMTILSERFIRASLDGGATWIDLLDLDPSFGTVAADVASVIMRNPTTGTTVTIADDALNGISGRTKVIMRRPGDFKIYPDLNPLPGGTQLGDASVLRTITLAATAPDPTVSLASASVSKAEGNAGVTIFTFTVARSATTGPASIGWSFAPGTTAASDFAGGTYPSGGIVTLADGIASGTFAVSIAGDTSAETDESFTVSIRAPVGYAPGATMSATGTILNDDAAAASYSWSGVSDGPALGSKYTLPFGTQNYSFDAAGKRIVLTRGGSAGGDTRVLFGPIYPPVSGQAFTVPVAFEVTGSSPSAGTSAAWTRNADGSSNGGSLANAANGTVAFAVPAGETGPLYLLLRQPQLAGSDNVLRIASVGPAA